MSAFYNKELGITKESISCSSQKTRCSHKRSHYRYKLLSELMSQITGDHLKCHLKCHFKDKLLSERMSPYWLSENYRYKGRDDVYTKISVLFYNVIMLYLNKRVALATLYNSFFRKSCKLFITRKCSIAAESHIRSHYHISSKIQLFW